MNVKMSPAYLAWASNERLSALTILRVKAALSIIQFVLMAAPLSKFWDGHLPREGKS